MQKNATIAQDILHDREAGTARLVAEYRNRLYAVALSLCHDPVEAEDLAFRTIERAVAKIELYEDRDSFYEWMQVILLNLYRNSVRGKKVGCVFPVGDAKELDGVADPSNDGDGARQVYAAVDSAILRDAICRLPPEMKETVVLHYFMDLPLKRIAQMLTVPVGTVMSRLYYARVVLRRRLGAQLKKPAVALVAAGLFLVASAAVVGVMTASAPSTEVEKTVAMMPSASPQLSATDAVRPDPSFSRPIGRSTSQETKSMKKKSSIISSYRKLMRGMTAVVLMSLAANGEENDPYIEADGTSVVNTGYIMKPDSRLEVDFALTTADQPAQARIFGADANNALFGMYYSLYITSANANTGMSAFGFGIGNGTKQSNYWAYYQLPAYNTQTFITPDTQRHQAVFDLFHDRLHFVTGGVTNWSRATGNQPFSNTCAVPLSLFGRFSDVTAIPAAFMAKARIYHVSIYERDELVHDFTPVLKGGLAGFKDGVTGLFVMGESVSALTAGGDVMVEGDDPYVATPATNYDTYSENHGLFIDTEYYATATTRVELDYAMNGTIPRQLHMMSGNGNYWYYCGIASNGLVFRNGPKWHANVGSSLITGRDVRRTVILDNVADQAVVMTAGFTNKVEKMDKSGHYNSNTIMLGARHDIVSNTTDYNTFVSNCAPIKIYGFRIYEDGELVRNFVPHWRDGAAGLKDTISGRFVTYPAHRGAKSLSYGGGLRMEANPYIETEKAYGQYFDTGYNPNSATRMELDYLLTGARTAGDTWYLFSGASWFAAYNNNSGFGVINRNGGNNWKSGVASAALADAQGVRRTAILDNVAGRGSLLTAGVTNGSVATEWQNSSGQTVKLSGTRDVSGYFGSMRIYGCRIYENGSPVHDYQPMVKNGVPGLQDRLSDTFLPILSKGASNPYVYGGAFPVAVSPAATKITSSQSTTLTATALGAVAYRWLRNGASIVGGENGTLTVAWGKGLAVDAYQAIAQFTVDGLTIEGEPSAAVTVENLPMGTIFMFR